MYSNGALWATNAMLGGTFPTHAPVKEAAAGEAPKFYGSEKPLAKKSIHKPTKLSSSCSSPADQIILREHDALFIANKGLKRGVAESSSADESESATGATTKHPRHRPGCGCVVCTQPPSRNGKNLSRRKKKRQSGPRAEVSEGYASEAPTMLINNINIRRGDVGDDMLAEALAGISMDSLIHAASMPLDMFLRENKNPSLT